MSKIVQHSSRPEKSEKKNEVSTCSDAELSLTPIARADFTAIFALQHDTAGARLAGVEGEFVEEEVFNRNMEQNIASDASQATVFTIREHGIIAGYIGVFEGAGGNLQLSYWLHSQFWGRGMGTRALALFLAHLPRQVIERPLYAAVVEENEASKRMLKRAGFDAYDSRMFFSAAHKAQKKQILFKKG